MSPPRSVFVRRRPLARTNVTRGELFRCARVLSVNQAHSFPRDGFCMWAGEMLFPISQGLDIVRVGVAVMAKVRAGVVLADVLRLDAAAGFTLSLVFAIIA